jgi:hypothetical protein
MSTAPNAAADFAKHFATQLLAEGRHEEASAFAAKAVKTLGSAAPVVDAPGAPAAPAEGPLTMSRDQMKALSMDEVEALQRTPEGVKLFNDSLRASARDAGKKWA